MDLNGGGREKGNLSGVQKSAIKTSCHMFYTAPFHPLLFP